MTSFVSVCVCVVVHRRLSSPFGNVVYCVAGRRMSGKGSKTSKALPLKSGKWLILFLFLLFAVHDVLSFLSVRTIRMVLRHSPLL